MKAHVFYLESQSDLYDTIDSLLREHVYQGIQVEAHCFSSSYPQASQATERDAFDSFVVLLKASLHTTKDFRIAVTDGQGTWSYAGTEERDQTYLTLPQSSFASVFPALAIRDRIVMAPRGIASVFDSSRGFSYLPKPFDMLGMLLVDFQDSRAVREAFQRVGSQLKDEITSLGQRQVFVRRILRLDLDDLARLLGEDRNFVTQHWDQRLVSSTKLVPSVTGDRVQRGVRSRVVLAIENPSGDDLGTVRVQVRAPEGTLQAPAGGYKYLDFSAGKPRTQSVEIEVTAKAAPFCPLEVQFGSDEAAQNYVPFPVPVILEVVDEAKRPPARD